MTASGARETKNDRRSKAYLQLSRVDWGDSVRNLGNNLKDSFVRNKDDAGGGNSMASAAAAAAYHYESSDPYGPSRFKPQSVDRLGDLQDLVGEDSDSEGEGGEPGESRKKRTYARVSCRQVLVVVALAAIIAGASVGIGAIVTGGDQSQQQNNAVVVPGPDQQRLLEIAEEVVTACGEHKLNEDLANCQKLCFDYMCCFEEDKYSCKDDEEKDCAVFSGCRALIEGVAVNKVIANVKKRKWGRV